MAAWTLMFAELGTFISVVLVVAWLGLGFWAAGHAIMYKRDPRGAALWVILCFTLPLIGPWLYTVLGINRFQRRAARIFGPRNRPYAFRVGPEGEDLDPEASSLVSHFGTLRRTTDRITRLPLLPGNRLEELHNGEQAYPAMLEAIDSARQSVTLASYIFDWDDVGRRFCDALSAAAGRGVAVHVLLDGVGAVQSWSRVGRQLLRSGALVAPFFPLRFPLGRARINLRNHRKILVVDGQTGFTGGMNISNRHWVQGNNPRRVEDLHFRVTGPIVGELQQVFVEDWQVAAEQSLEGSAYFPPLSPTGTAVCRGIAGGPDDDFEKTHLFLLAAFAAAQTSARVVTPYFIPTAPLIRAMVLAALRGVRVTLLLPSVVDLLTLRWAADAYLWQLLEHGVRVFRRPSPFVHTKLMVLDDRWTLFGSANLDPRSFRLNFEFNVEAYDVKLAQRLGSWLDSLTAASKEVTLQEVDSRSIPRRLRDGLVRLFSPHL